MDREYHSTCREGGRRGDRRREGREGGRGGREGREGGEGGRGGREGLTCRHTQAVPEGLPLLPSRLHGD